MIYTVIPNDKTKSWKDCETYAEAVEYGEWLESGYTIEETEGEVV